MKVNHCIYFDAQPIYQQTTKEIFWGNWGSVIWPGHRNWTSFWKTVCEHVCLKTNQRTPKMCSGWTKRSVLVPGCTVGTELSLHRSDGRCSSHTVQWSLWSGEMTAEQNACISHHCITITRPQIRLHLWKRCAEVLFSFVVMLKYLTRGKLLCSARGWNMHHLWKSQHLFLYTVLKHCWIFIHVAEAGLPCKCILQIFPLSDPSCTGDNLQYSFFC